MPREYRTDEMRLRRRAGSPIAPHMDEVYVDLHLLTELVLETYDGRGLSVSASQRVRELVTQLHGRFEAQKKEIEHGPPPSP